MIEALGRIGDPRAVEPLSQILQTLHPRQGYAYSVVINALRDIGGHQALSCLIQVFRRLTPNDGYIYDVINNAILHIQTKERL